MDLNAFQAPPSQPTNSCLIRINDVYTRVTQKSNNSLIVGFFTLIIGITVFLGVLLHNSAAKRTAVKEDYAQINSFRYGLLSIDAWKKNIQKIVTERLNEFQLTKEQKKALQTEMNGVLNGLLAEADKAVKDPDSGLGAIKTSFAKSYIKTARKNLSNFSGSILEQIEKPDTLKKLKQMALEQFNTYAATTHSSPEDVGNLNWLLAKNHVTSVEQFNATAQQKIKDLSSQSRNYALMLIATAFLFGLAWWYVLKIPELHNTFFVMSMIFALVLLLTSVSIPLMEIDARIKSVDLVLIGEHIRFTEQVVYFRSKSLMQVVTVLMRSSKVDSIAVGVLVFLFSILFPMTKLLAAGLYLRGKEKIKTSKFIQFFAFKSGKWSMADVTVVAIFMAYIGFQGIIQTQLENLNVKTDMVETITTDASSMQPGLILFTTFVLFSMGLSEILKRITETKRKELVPLKKPEPVLV